jgi:hypothetical protein
MFIPLFFWLPAIVSATALVLLRYQDDLSPRATVVFGVWFLLALALEWLARWGSPAWVAGLRLQTFLAVGLVIRWRMTG